LQSELPLLGILSYSAGLLQPEAKCRRRPPRNPARPTPL